jgi:hypothetical protein
VSANDDVSSAEDFDPERREAVAAAMPDAIADACARAHRGALREFGVE